MPTKVNPLMIRNGYATAKNVAAALHKSVPTVHRMVEMGDLLGTVEGGVLYVNILSLERHYADNAPMLDAVKKLRAEPPPRRVAKP